MKIEINIFLTYIVLELSHVGTFKFYIGISPVLGFKLKSFIYKTRCLQKDSKQQWLYFFLPLMSDDTNDFC